ncbi:MAG TPA: flagellin [Myxococcales bacterium]|nr:flagellin [Myxococcales bacterium]
MSVTIRSNISSLSAQNSLSQTENALSSSLAKLSSGMRITSASDDAAGLGISMDLESDVASYNQAARNANDGISVAQTAEGALNEVTNIVTRLRELAMESASDGVGDTQRGYINTEATQLTGEIDQIANSTEYNNTKLLNSTSTTLDFQVGIRNDANNDVISVTSVDATSATLFGGTIDLSTKTGAQAALDTLDTALDAVASASATFGAVSNRLNSAVNTIQSASQNLSAADSRIRDVDVAAETSNMSRLQVLAQAGVSVLAQANQEPQIALKLLQ